MGQIARPDQPIDFRSQFDKASRRMANRLTEKEQKEIEQEERIVAEKLAEVAKSRKPINFFIPPLVTLIKNTPSDILCELGVRAFTGSRDMPKDVERAIGLFMIAEQNAKTDKEKS
mmetsp:Transcript_23974/g.32131  ORF Transcript_23974/g.32131 Transcript_23974/m.32131 type:complete len:116 (+) Transcript_23974:319-666(+)